MNIKSHLFDIKTRENSGSSSSNRFDFQKDWAICKILELHETGKDYLLTLEQHDDIIVFDSSTDPKKISFYQVKTNKAQHWTVNSLVKRKKGKNVYLNSHLGKLFDHLLKFNNTVESLNFVTNNKIKGTLKNDSKCQDVKEFCCSDLSDIDLKNILDNLKIETPKGDLQKFKNLTFFKLGELNIEQHSTITKGKLSEFIDRNFKGVKYQIGPLYRTIFDEVKNKSNVEYEMLTFEELKKHKSISRENFLNYLKVLDNISEMNDIAIKIENRLNSENVDFLFLKNFKKNAKAYEIQRMTYNDKILLKLVKDIKKKIEENSSNLQSRLLDSMNLISEKIKINNYVTATINLDYIKTIILFDL